MKCKICGNDKNLNQYTCRDKMYNLDESFDYIECLECGTLQIVNIPENIAEYYPRESYYSYKKDHYGVMYKLRLFQMHEILKRSFLGYLFSFFFAKQDIASIAKLKLPLNAKILDVGCGNGSLINKLKDLGYENVLGVDPFITQDLVYENGAKVMKNTIFSIKKKFNLIMLHHSFEHMDNPFEVMRKINKILYTGGICIIRVPIISSYAWKHYRENWVQLDAPRHFFLYSPKSFNVLTKGLSLFIDKIIYDSTELQFWGSQLYKKNKSILDVVSIIQVQFKRVQFFFPTKYLNLIEQGDSITIYLKKRN